MKLELHPKAVKNFNEKADILMLELAVIPQKPSPTPRSSFHPDSFVSAHITEKDIIGEIRFSMVDQAGVKVAKYFKHNDKLIGLHGERYKRLVRISQEMQRTKGLCKRVSVTLLTDLIFDWMKDKYKKTTNLSMVEHVLSKCKESMQELEIWIPIAMLHIQSEIEIGRITLKTITKEMFDRWRAETEKKNLGDNDKIQKMFDKEQKEVQGLAAATIKVCAEPKRAFEIALQETEKSISLLRFFSPSNFHPEITSYCTVLGKESSERTKHLVIREGQLVQINSAIVDKAIRHWVIGDALFSMLERGGLEILSNLLVQERRTEFQEKLLDSLLLYSKSSLAKTPADKLVYILVALESILLKNESELIQQNIGERMAFFIGRNVSERKSIIRNLKKAYTLRSSFVHHGHTIEDLETLKEFMLNTWRFFSHLIQNANRFNTGEQLIDAIEERKLT